MKDMNEIKKNTFLMLSRRGYDIDKKEDIAMFRYENMEFTRVNDILVVFIVDTKVSTDIMKNVLDLRKDDERIILIHSHQLTADVKKKKLDSLIETFETDEMSFDLLDIVPVHELVTEKPKEWNKLPIIRKNDIACRYFNFQVGSVIKFIEDDNTIQYRRVC